MVRDGDAALRDDDFRHRATAFNTPQDFENEELDRRAGLAYRETPRAAPYVSNTRVC